MTAPTVLATLGCVDATSHTFALDGDRTAPADMRRRLAELLGERVGHDALRRAQLVGTELVSNAVVHGDGPISVTVDATDERIRLEVVDSGTGARDIRVRTGGEDGGWGLQIVSRLASRWGVVEGTTHVWCEIPVLAAT